MRAIHETEVAPSLPINSLGRFIDFFAEAVDVYQSPKGVREVEFILASELHGDTLSIILSTPREIRDAFHRVAVYIESGYSIIGIVFRS